MTTPYVTFYEGITRTFNDFQTPIISSYQENVEQGGMKGIEKHYQQRAKNIKCLQLFLAKSSKV
jgi:hypothetical protein